MKHNISYAGVALPPADAIVESLIESRTITVSWEGEKEQVIATLRANRTGVLVYEDEGKTITFEAYYVDAQVSSLKRYDEDLNIKYVPQTIAVFRER